MGTRWVSGCERANLEEAFLVAHRSISLALTAIIEAEKRGERDPLLSAIHNTLVGGGACSFLIADGCDVPDVTQLGVDGAIELLGDQMEAFNLRIALEVARGA